MLIRVCSDLHSEFWTNNSPTPKVKRILNNMALPPLEEDSETVLVIAGDLGTLKNLKVQEIILEEVSKRFKNIIICGGNHEWWHGDMVKDQKEYTNLYSKFPNILFGYTNVIDNVNFIVSTLWTDFNKNNPLDKEISRASMNDYKFIEVDGENLTPTFLYKEHLVALTNIREELRKSTSKHNIIITHHLPSFRSVPVIHKTSKLNGSYASDLEELIKENNIEMWIHGHTHTPVDYNIGKTNIICNPYGYKGYEETNYNSKLVKGIQT